ncbi:MAG: class I SAM-dependent methyltransferase [Chloroflexi bacterium]|nr:class I SAM-dependent methyltransferase [Chloroflexota bacterium]
MRLTREEILATASTIPQRRGWDYSAVRDRRDPVPWDYEQVVRAYLRPEHLVMDSGTGGGERFLSLRGAYALGLGIDPDPRMVSVARENGRLGQAAHVHWAQARGEALPVCDATVDMVLNRHASITPEETLRVLRPGGLLIMQEVGARNLDAVCRCFGCGPGGQYDYDPDQSIYTLAERFRALGGSILAVAEYDVPYVLLDLASLLFLLQGVGIPEDFDPARHWPQITEIVERCRTGEGIRTNEHRELLIVRRE